MQASSMKLLCNPISYRFPSLFDLFTATGMETFISDLKERQVNKFNQLRREQIRWNQSRSKISDEQHDLIEEINDCLDTRDEQALESAIDKWLENPIPQLPRATLCEVVEFSSSVGNAELYGKLIALIKASDPELYADNLSYFHSLRLELDWRIGKNIDELIEKFESMYKQGLSNEVAMEHATKLSTIMIQDAVERKGESVVIKLKARIEAMCKESGDYQLLFDLWRNLFER